MPLDQPPFACVPLWAGGSNTSGGPRRDASARILDVHGDPIPGLFGAGELGQVLGLLYPADGSNLSDAFVFGRLAAETPVAERLTGRTALVTGAGSGFGEAASLRFAEEGAAVLCVDLDGDAAARTAEAVTAAGGLARAFQADVAEHGRNGGRRGGRRSS